MKRILFSSLVAFATAFPGCHEAASNPGPGRRPDIVFVVADTLRRDHVGVYGQNPGGTPFLDTLADRSVVFDRAYSQSPWTMPSVASMFTSRYPSQNEILSFGSVLDADERTLAEILRDNGYSTGGFIANILLGSASGFGQGFDEFQILSHSWSTGHPKGRGDELRNAALEWVDNVKAEGKPVFLYVHYMEPHTPFEPPDDLVLQALGGSPRPDVAALNLALGDRAKDLTDDEVRLAKFFYKLEVAHLDRQVQQIFAGLEQRAILKDAIFVFTADHGEGMYERGYWGHGESLHDEEIAVPLLIGMPNQSVRVDVPENVALIDVAPTLLEMAGIPSPVTFEGRSLTRVHRSARSSLEQWFSKRIFRYGDDAIPIATEFLSVPGVKISHHERAVILGRRKLIQNTEGQLEFYDLQSDPGEQKAIRWFDEIPSSLGDALNIFTARVGTHGASGPAPEIDAATKERMRALGYAE